MNILAIDTVTEMCSVALLKDDKSIAQAQHVPRRHTLVILGMIKSVLAEAQLGFLDLDAISFSRGPGSFTGLRICASVTQGLALAHDLPVIPVSSLAIMAQGAYRLEQPTAVVACMDARKDEVYWACYEVVDDLVRLIGGEIVSPPGQVELDDSRQWHGVGTGFQRFAAELNRQTLVNLASVNAEHAPLAEDMLVLAKDAWLKQEYVDVSLAIPTYLRDNVAIPPQS